MLSEYLPQAVLAATFQAHHYEVGETVGLLYKAGAQPEATYSLSGKLYLSSTNWLLLSVPNSLLRGLYSACHEPGVELPLHEGQLNAHCSVMTATEVEKIGPACIKERGKQFAYQLGQIAKIKPTTWDGVSTVYVVKVISPELKRLRVSYGLTPLPYGDHDLHISFGIVKTHVLKPGPMAKAGETYTGLHAAYDGYTKAKELASNPYNWQRLHDAGEHVVGQVRAIPQAISSLAGKCVAPVVGTLAGPAAAVLAKTGELE